MLYYSATYSRRSQSLVSGTLPDGALQRERAEKRWKSLLGTSDIRLGVGAVHTKTLQNTYNQQNTFRKLPDLFC